MKTNSKLIRLNLPKELIDLKKVFIIKYSSLLDIVLSVVIENENCMNDITQKVNQHQIDNFEKKSKKPWTTKRNIVNHFKWYKKHYKKNREKIIERSKQYQKDKKNGQ